MKGIYEHTVVWGEKFISSLGGPFPLFQGGLNLLLLFAFVELL